MTDWHGVADDLERKAALAGEVSSDPEERSYYDGCRDAVRWLAVWVNGRQYVGVMRTPLGVVLAEIDAAEDRLERWGEPR